MAETNKRSTGTLMIILAACFWGSMGIFVRKLTELGFSSVQIVTVRVTLAALFFCALLLIREPSGFRIALRTCRFSSDWGSEASCSSQSAISPPSR